MHPMDPIYFLLIQTMCLRLVVFHIMPDVETDQTAQLDKTSYRNKTQTDKGQIDLAETTHTKGLFHEFTRFSQDTTVQPFQHSSIYVEDRLQPVGDC